MSKTWLGIPHIPLDRVEQDEIQEKNIFPFLRVLHVWTSCYFTLHLIGVAVSFDIETGTTDPESYSD